MRVRARVLRGANEDKTRATFPKGMRARVAREWWEDWLVVAQVKSGLVRNAGVGAFGLAG